MPFWLQTGNINFIKGTFCASSNKCTTREATRPCMITRNYHHLTKLPILDAPMRLSKSKYTFTVDRLMFNLVITTNA